MKKLLYIFTVLTAVLLLDSCTKEVVTNCDRHEDPFAIDNSNDGIESRTSIQDNGSTDGSFGGVIDKDDDDDEMDEDNDVIVDPDENDDEMDEDDDEQVENHNGTGEDAN